MVTPSGCSGVQRVPKAGHSGGLRSPQRTRPLMHSLGASSVRHDRAEARLGIEVAVGVGKPEAALGDLADAAPAARERPGRPRA